MVSVLPGVAEIIEPSDFAADERTFPVAAAKKAGAVTVLNAQ